MSTPPNASIAAPNASTDGRARRSRRRRPRAPGLAEAAHRVVRRPRASMSKPTTHAPAPASDVAIAARPIPPAAPVTSATLPWSSPGGGASDSLYSSSGQYSIAKLSASVSETNSVIALRAGHHLDRAVVEVARRCAAFSDRGAGRHQADVLDQHDARIGIRRHRRRARGVRCEVAPSSPRGSGCAARDPRRSAQRRVSLDGSYGTHSGNMLGVHEVVGTGGADARRASAASPRVDELAAPTRRQVGRAGSSSAALETAPRSVGRQLAQRGRRRCVGVETASCCALGPPKRG